MFHLKNKKVLVIGDTGFIVSNVDTALKNYGVNVEVYPLSLGLNVKNKATFTKFAKKSYEILLSQKKAIGQIHNLGHRQSIPLKEMTEMIVKLSGKGGIEYVPWPKNYKKIETGSYISDITKIKEFGFIPNIDFKTEIERSIKE